MQPGNYFTFRCCLFAVEIGWNGDLHCPTAAASCGCWGGEEGGFFSMSSTASREPATPPEGGRCSSPPEVSSCKRETHTQMLGNARLLALNCLWCHHSSVSPRPNLPLKGKVYLGRKKYNFRKKLSKLKYILMNINNFITSLHKCLQGWYFYYFLYAHWAS